MATRRLPSKPTVKNAIKAINDSGALLLYPLNNRPDIPSLWSFFYPKKRMSWDWSDDGTDEVVVLWHLRAELSQVEEVVYTKWFQGRATFFSREVFTALLSLVVQLPDPLHSLSEESRTILSTLEEDSPLATKSLRARAALTGRELEKDFSKAMRQLWSRLLVVAHGEVDEGGFPSLAVGATRLLREELWDEAKVLSQQERNSRVLGVWSQIPPFLKNFGKFERTLMELTRDAGEFPSIERK